MTSILNSVIGARNKGKEVHGNPSEIFLICFIPVEFKLKSLRILCRIILSKTVTN